MRVLTQLVAGLLGAFLATAVYIALAVFRLGQVAPTFGVDVYGQSGQLIGVSVSAPGLGIAAIVGFVLGFLWMRRRHRRHVRAGRPH